MEECLVTRDETIKILMVIQAAYPNYKPPDKTVAVNVWAEMMSDIPYEQVSAAVKAYIQTDKNGFAPGIGDIREKAQMLFGEDAEINETEAWSLVLKAIRRSTYYSDEEFAKLPPVIQRSVSSPRQLREWATLEDVDGKTLTVIQSNFQRTFRTEQQKERERNKLSQDVLKLMKPLNNHQIEEKPKELSVPEQRMFAEENARPAPGDFREKLYSILGNTE